LAVWSTINYSQLFGATRLDSEFYQPKYEEVESIVSEFEDTVTLGDIASTFAKGIFDIKAEEYVDEGVPFVRISNLKNCVISENDIAFITSNRHKAERKTALVKYDLILSKTAYPAASLVQIEHCNVSQDTIAIKTTCSEAFNVYLAIYLNTRLGLLQMERIFQGNIQMHLSLTDAKTIRVPVPSEEFQRKIQGLFEQSLQKREESKTLYAEAEALLIRELGLDAIDSDLQCFYEANFSDTTELKRIDAEYWNPKYTNLIKRLKSSEYAELGSIATFSNGATPKGAEYLTEGIPFLRIQNVLKNRLDLDDVVYISEKIHKGLLRRSQLIPKDVLITITGRIGTAAVVPENLPVANMNQHSVRLRIIDETVNPYYLAVFLNSQAGMLQTERESYGATREALPYYCLERIIIPRASSPLQKKVESVIRSAENKLLSANNLLNEAKKRIEDMILGR
jgi:type I restriction enzyme S subunit